MNKMHSALVIIVLSFLNLSCMEEKSPEKEIDPLEVIKSSETDTLKFTSGIRAIFQDSKGNFWFGSQNEGVSYYNGESFRYFTQKEGLADNQIRSIQEDESGKIWFETGNGVSVYDGAWFTNYSTKINDPTFDWNATSGNLWFHSGGMGKGVNRFDGKNMNYLTFPNSANERSDDSYGVTDISKDNDGAVWIATYDALFSYNGKDVTIFDSQSLNLKDNERVHIRSVFADSKGRIWIGNNGIGVLLMENDKTVNFSENQGLIHQNSSKNGNSSPAGTMEHVFVIEEDSEGNIWFGDRDTGAWKYDGEIMKNYTIDSKLSSPMIWSIYKDKSNKLYFGMANGGVYSFNGKSFDKAF